MNTKVNVILNKLIANVKKKVNVNISFLFAILSFVFQLNSSFLTSKSTTIERAMVE